MVFDDDNVDDDDPMPMFDAALQHHEGFFPQDLTLGVGLTKNLTLPLAQITNVANLIA